MMLSMPLAELDARRQPINSAGETGNFRIALVELGAHIAPQFRDLGGEPGEVLMMSVLHLREGQRSPAAPRGQPSWAPMGDHTTDSERI
jgi:hypothetical protein